MKVASKDELVADKSDLLFVYTEAVKKPMAVPSCATKQRGDVKLKSAIKVIAKLLRITTNNQHLIISAILDQNIS